jgi:small conductance mechanosensitive channel
VEVLPDILPALGRLLPALAVLAASALALWLVDWLLRRRERRVGGSFGRQLGMLLLTALAIVLVILVLPISDTTRGQLFGLLGLILTAVIALSSTTFVSNAMAGLMLRSVGSFRPGDFVRVGEQMGRVTERGLFHTEIQTEDRDLTTFPNLFLVSNPVTVVRSSGTIVSCSLSLGYDVPRARVEPLLLEAARAAELEDPFVRILELGDFSVTYRAAGFLSDVKLLLSARSKLREKVLDTLHGAGVEIVSPTFMNQRRLEPGARVIPSEGAEEEQEEARRAPERPAREEAPPEEVIFDKAEEAEKLEKLRAEREALLAAAKELEERLSEAEGAEREALESRIAERRRRAEVLETSLEAAQQERERRKQAGAAE